MFFVKSPSPWGEEKYLRDSRSERQSWFTVAERSGRVCLRWLMRGVLLTPTIRHMSPTTSHESCTNSQTVPRRPLAGAALQRLPSFDDQEPTNSDPQLVSLHGCEGQVKTLGFLFFLCVCVCVWARL